MKINSLLILLGILIISILGCQRKTPVSTTDRSIDLILNNYYSKGELNGTVLVVRDGKELHHKSYGYADGSKETLLSNDFSYAIGSIYKEFPAVLIMRLKERNLLALDDKLSKYLPELPNWSQQISITNLLQYTSGLPRISWNKYFSENKVITEQDIMNDLLAIEALEFVPGAGYLYTNNSPFLLTKIIERIAKKDFADYINEQLFVPFKLKHTTLKLQYPYSDKAFMALPFDADYKEDAYRVSIPTLLFTSNSRDLYRWFTLLNTYKIISRESLHFLAKTADLEQDELQAPLGNCLLAGNEITQHTHHGSVGNYECLAQRYNNKDLTIIVLTNQKNKNVFEIARAIAVALKEVG